MNRLQPLIQCQNRQSLIFISHTLTLFVIYNLERRQLSLIWSYSISHHDFPSVFISNSDACVFPFIEMCAGDLSALVMNPAHLDRRHFLERAVRGLWNKAWREKHRGFGFALPVIYGEDPSILLCAAGRGNTGSGGGGRGGGDSGKWRIQNEATTPNSKHVGFWGRTTGASGFQQTMLQSATQTHTHTHTLLDTHTGKTKSASRGIPDLCLHLRSRCSPSCCEANGSPCQLTYFQLLLAALYKLTFPPSRFI